MQQPAVRVPCPTLNKNLILFNRLWSGFAAGVRKSCPFGKRPWSCRLRASLRFPAAGRRPPAESCFVRMFFRAYGWFLLRTISAPAVCTFLCFRRVHVSHDFRISGRSALRVVFPRLRSDDFPRFRRRCPARWFLRLRDLLRMLSGSLAHRLRTLPAFSDGACRVCSGVRLSGNACCGTA